MTHETNKAEMLSRIHDVCRMTQNYMGRLAEMEKEVRKKRAPILDELSQEIQSILAGMPMEGLGAILGEVYWQYPDIPTTVFQKLLRNDAVRLHVNQAFHGVCHRCGACCNCERNGEPLNSRSRDFPLCLSCRRQNFNSTRLSKCETGTDWNEIWSSLVCDVDRDQGRGDLIKFRQCPWEAGGLFQKADK